MHLDNLKRKQMENKYFTPDIEDLCIGYECELLMNTNVSIINPTSNAPEFKPFIFEKNKIELLIELYDSIRVPYLTKEQIEAEGWTSFITEYKGDIVPENMTYTFFREDRNYMLGWNFNTNKITLIIKDPSLVENYYNEPTFRGECKDINTFRKIIKLLGI